MNQASSSTNIFDSMNEGARPAQYLQQHREKMGLTELATDILQDWVASQLDVPQLGMLLLTESNHKWKLIFERRQAELRHKLLGATGVGNKWCWLHPPVEQCCDYECAKREGTLVRHVMQADNYSVYRGLGWPLAGVCHVFQHAPPRTHFTLAPTPFTQNIRNNT